MLSLLRRGIAGMGLTLPDAAADQLARYLGLLIKWNRVYNLTAIHDESKLVSHHVLDCLAVVAHLPEGTVVDVGSGAGLPGIPIAIACPGLEVGLLDSNHKKAAFLQQAVGELGLANTRVIVERAEIYRPLRLFDAVVSRAFSDLADFVRLAGHLCAPHGVMIAMKGLYPHEEIAQVPSCWQVETSGRLVIPQVEAARHLVFLRRPTSKPTDQAPCHAC
jgi:16S rRNA (guanine527-N7)-methyltransferase